MGHLTFFSLLATICNIADTNGIPNSSLNVNENETIPHSDMFLSEDQLRHMNIIEDPIEYSANTSNYDYELDSHVVYGNRDLFRWKKVSLNSSLTEIPYEFDDVTLFEEPYKSEIISVIDDFNSMFDGCIKLRYIMIFF